MSRVIPGIQGVPFRKIVKREIQPGPGIQGRVYIETLSCGHKNVTAASTHVTKRRCYHSDCRKEPK